MRCQISRPVVYPCQTLKTHDMSGKLKTGDQLLKIIESDIQYIYDKFGIVVIAWCTDDGPNSKKMRQLLGIKY